MLIKNWIKSNRKRSQIIKRTLKKHDDQIEDSKNKKD